jgi:hypothetical protein
MVLGDHLLGVRKGGPVLIELARRQLDAADIGAEYDHRAYVRVIVGELAVQPESETPGIAVSFVARFVQRFGAGNHWSP